MIKDLAKVANRLDSLGLTKEADFLDSIICKIAATIPADIDKIIMQLKSSMNLDDAAAKKIKKFIALKNLTLSPNANEAASAERNADNFIQKNQDIKTQLEEAARLWDTWDSWSGTLNQGTTDAPAASWDAEGWEKESYNDPRVKPGMRFSDPKIPLTKQVGTFDYLSPFDEEGNLMDFDTFVETYVKKGVVPVNLSSSTKSMFFEYFLNTADEVYDMDETAVDEYIGMMQMEDSIYKDLSGGKSRFFGEDEDEVRQDEQVASGTYGWSEEDRTSERYRNEQKKRIKSLSEQIKNTNLLGAQSKKEISGPGRESDQMSVEKSNANVTGNNPAEEKLLNEILSALELGEGEPKKIFGEYVEGLRQTDMYKIMSSDPETYYNLFLNNKEKSEEIAKEIAFFNPQLFARLKLFRIWNPDQYEFSDNSLVALIEDKRTSYALDRSVNGATYFFKKELWKDLPEHFSELAAYRVPYSFFSSTLFNSGKATKRVMALASKSWLEGSMDPKYWLNLTFKNEKGQMVKLSDLLPEYKEYATQLYDEGFYDDDDEEDHPIVHPNSSLW